MNYTKDIPVLLLTGYLGSGKTTLVNHILTNKQGLRFAVIVNDIGEVNIDASLIQSQGVVSAKDESLVALQNGCICCTLRTDLIEQLYEITKTENFDYIVIEASGICEPEPIAQTICSIPSLGEAYIRHGYPRLDNVVTVVDALRMQSEFACGKDLTDKKLDEDDIENLLIQQIEFCNMVLLNKASEVSEEEREHIKKIIHILQPAAEIIECDYADVPFETLIDTHKFNYRVVTASAGWVRELGKAMSEKDAHPHHEADEQEKHECTCHHDHEGDECHHHEEHEHHHDGHCHCHNCEHGEADEYGISSFVYYRRGPFDPNKFDYFIMKRWPKEVIRCKGVCYFNDKMDTTYLFEQAGVQKQISDVGQWYAALPEEQIVRVMQQEPGLLRDWDQRYGDRMQKLVFIGQHMDKEGIIRDLDNCLVEKP